VCALIGFGLTAVLFTSCSSEETFLFFLVTNARKQAATPVAPPGSPSDASLARLARCESGGNPRAVSRSGRYFGLYQFDQHTWNGVASSVMPDYVGVSPAAAPPEVQTALARALHSARGRSPWPVCGRRM
jgi:hypothetical protein